MEERIKWPPYGQLVRRKAHKHTQNGGMPATHS